MSQVIDTTVGVANEQPQTAETKAKVNTRVSQYVQVRDALKALEEEYERKKAPLVELQNLLNGWLMDVLDKAGADSIKTDAGTCYLSTRYTASLADPDAFMKHVISTGQYELLDRRANATAVKDYVKAHNNLPPGANLSAVKTLGVRRR